MDQPTGLKTLNLEAQKRGEEKCEMAKGAYNSARRAKLAYSVLIFMFMVVLVVAAVVAVLSFQDDETTRGILSTVTSAGSLATTGVLGVVAKSASDDEKAMWERVVATC